MVAMKRRSPLHVRRHGPEQGRAGLSGAVRAAEALDGDVGPPAGLQQVAAPGAARGGEDQDALGAVHERGRFGEVRGGRTRRDGQAGAAGGGQREDAARAAGDFGDHVVAEVVHEDVDGGRHGRQGAEFHHQAIAGLEGLLGLDRVAEVVDGGYGDHLALVVDALFLQLRRESAVGRSVSRRGEGSGWCACGGECE